jgi:hypothetical protein
MHAPKDSDYIIDMPDIGSFRFAKATLGDRAAIRSRYLAIVKDSDDNELQAFATILAKHAVLCVDAPKEWLDLDVLVMTEWHEQQLVILYSKLNELEHSFRTGAIQGSQAQGQGTVPDVSIVVSDAIQPTA